jgi:micrococcal nuclease
MAGLVVALLLAACSGPPTPNRTTGVAVTTAPSRTAAAHGDPALVTRVIDGDTIEVSYRGRDLDVRLIGVDTPETVAPGRPVECGGPAASAFTKARLDGRRVELEFDVERLDRYGRTLAYVWVDGRLFNRTLVARGYARVATYPPDVAHVDAFLAAERHARAANLGLWSACSDSGADLIGGGQGSGACDPSYPGVCIPPPPPELDCSDVRFDHFQVLPPDPHRFDGDGNGIGCEAA